MVSRLPSGKSDTIIRSLLRGPHFGRGRGSGDSSDHQSIIALPRIPGKVLVLIPLRQTRDHLLMQQIQVQPGFTPDKSTVVCILALQIFVELRQSWAVAAKVDFKMAFEPVYHE